MVSLNTDALDIAIELYSWAYAEKNKFKAKKLWKLARKYEKIFDEK